MEEKLVTVLVPKSRRITKDQSTIGEEIKTAHNDSDKTSTDPITQDTSIVDLTTETKFTVCPVTNPRTKLEYS